MLTCIRLSSALADDCTAPYMSMKRPSFSGLPSRISYGQTFTLKVALPTGTAASAVSVSLMDLCA